MDKAKRPRVVDGLAIQVITGCGKAYIIPTYIDGKLFECFMHLGKAGGCAIAQGEALLRSISIGLRYGIPVEEYTDQLREIRCPSPAWDNGKQVRSCPDAIAQVLLEYATKPGLVTTSETEEEAAKSVQQLSEERERTGLNG